MGRGKESRDNAFNKELAVRSPCPLVHTTLTPEAQGTSQKKRQEDCQSQRTRTAAARSCLLRREIGKGVEERREKRIELGGIVGGVSCEYVQSTFTKFSMC